jgi:hypothetical protein
VRSRRDPTLQPPPLKGEGEPDEEKYASGPPFLLGKGVRGFGLSLLFLLPTLARADDPNDPPLVGRPVFLPFSGASARFVVGPDRECRVPFALSATASPTELAPRSALVYTVTLRALGPIARPPQRLDLRQVGDFKRLFYIEPVGDEQEGHVTPTSWRRRYRLTPRSSEVDEIPGFPFVFYNPDLQPAEKAFQVLYSDPIAIRQKPSRATVGPPDVDEETLSLADSSALDAKAPWRGPNPAGWILVGLAPPLMSVVCYLLWCRLYPDALRAAARRRSRAARLALEAIRLASRGRGRVQAEQLTAAVVGYLRARVDLGQGEPTPEEVSVQMAVRGFPEESIRETAALLALCAAARFAPSDANDDLVGRARRVIQGIEEASCPQ